MWKRLECAFSACDRAHLSGSPGSGTSRSFSLMETRRSGIARVCGVGPPPGDQMMDVNMHRTQTDSPKNMLLSIAPTAQGFAVFPPWCPAGVGVSMCSSSRLCMSPHSSEACASVHVCSVRSSAARRCSVKLQICLSVSSRTGPPLPSRPSPLP